MPLLQIRDLPEHLHRKLVSEAAREHRSLSQQAIALLAKGLEVEADPKARRREALRRAALIDRRQTRDLPDPVKLIREDRNR
jgi:plasmid stability protein